MTSEAAVGRQVVQEQGSDRIFVGNPEMVGFDASLDEDLSVCRNVQGRGLEDHVTAGFHGNDVRCQAAEVGLHIDVLLCGQRHPDPARILLARHRMQPVLLAIESGKTRLLVGDTDQLAGDVIGPGVLRATAALLAACAFSHQLGAAMAAHVVEGPGNARLIA